MRLLEESPSYAAGTEHDFYFPINEGNVRNSQYVKNSLPVLHCPLRRWNPEPSTFSHDMISSTARQYDNSRSKEEVSSPAQRNRSLSIQETGTKLPTTQSATLVRAVRMADELLEGPHPKMKRIAKPFISAAGHRPETAVSNTDVRIAAGRNRNDDVSSHKDNTSGSTASSCMHSFSSLISDFTRRPKAALLLTDQEICPCIPPHGASIMHLIHHFRLREPEHAAFTRYVSTVARYEKETRSLFRMHSHLKRDRDTSVSASLFIAISAYPQTNDGSTVPVVTNPFAKPAEEISLCRIVYVKENDLREQCSQSQNEAYPSELNANCCSASSHTTPDKTICGSET